MTRIVRTASAKADRPQPLPPAKRSHTTQLPMISSWDTIIDRGGGSDGRQVCDVAPLQDGQGLLTAWGVGGVFGPILIAPVKDLTGGYGTAMRIIAVVMLVAVVIPLIVRLPRTEAERVEKTPAAVPQLGT